MTHTFKFKSGDKVRVSPTLGYGEDQTGTVQYCRYGYGGGIFPLCMVKFDRPLPKENGGWRGAEIHENGLTLLAAEVT